MPTIAIFQIAGLFSSSSYAHHASLTIPHMLTKLQRLSKKPENVYNFGNRNAVQCNAHQVAVSHFKTKPVPITLASAILCTSQASSGMKT